MPTQSDIDLAREVIAKYPEEPDSFKPSVRLARALLETVDVSTDVESFHKKFGLEYGGRPRVVVGQLGEFRVKFLEEELREYKKAYYQASYDLQARPEMVAEHLEDMLDALVDIVYVAVGNAYIMGLPFDEAWRRVHVANMAKQRATTPSERGGMFDVVKPPGWTPPSHRDLVEHHAHVDDREARVVEGRKNVYGRVED